MGNFGSRESSAKGQEPPRLWTLDPRQHKIANGK